MGAALRVEVDAILVDPLFTRAPIQSKLLLFLCEQAIEGDKNLTQYAIAVDGLGKPENYDLQNDSYPRVQVSRLRSNLANYYSRNEPVAEHCAYIRQGDYRLRLGSRKMAYPDSLQSKGAKPESIEPSQAESGTPSQPVPAQLAAVETRKKPFFANRHFLAFGAGAISLAALGVLVGAQTQRAKALAPPSIELKLTGTGEFSDASGSNDLLTRVARVSRNQLNQSFVSNLAAPQSDSSGDEDYIVTVDLGQGVSRPDAQVTLRASDDTLLYSETVAYRDDDSVFLTDISASLVFLIAPNGVIAKNELAQVSEEPQSPYQCFISIENSRTRGIETANLLDFCIDKFPKDRFASFWYARKAYMMYQSEILGGKEVTRSADAWKYVTRALAIDEHNAFANFVATKVTVAEGACDSARGYIAKAKERGTSYPTLLSAAETEASGCPTDDAEQTTEHKQLNALIARNPAPDGLLHTNMMLAALAIERRDLAVEVADRLIISEPDSTLERTSTLLRRSIQEPGFYRKNEEEIRDLVALFVWNKGAKDKIHRQLRQT
ncbi:hypothetical protein GRI41_07485 [Altererythrobacter aquaemixtae]|uniref:Uncharacterized protein n=2 Tax=Pontixanthobacter aquaemixtae TaxID=1958940 RepID=A0A844ZSE6_9SPHN|nr:hypothetical protein [Pontixanthobacter aquaemixtae]